MSIRYSGDSIGVEASGRKYTVTIMPGYFRTVEEKKDAAANLRVK
jgi:hypothetical protein